MTTESATGRLKRLADEARGPLADLYRDLDRAVSELAPVCELSGRCCRFEEYGHTLFVSEVEAAVLIADAPAPVRPLDSGATCPWQDSKGRCVAREARPLGCRVYFCDPRYEDHAPTISERFLSRLKALCDARGWAWNYAPLHRHLAVADSEGELAPAVAADGATQAAPPRDSAAPPEPAPETGSKARPSALEDARDEPRRGFLLDINPCDKYS